ncbi:ATP-binding protein [Sporomusa sp.]|uniref:ATP-binding protein n=1 Tax=Sporomusa sp. TaxID=2078658 RepID=UPI002B5A7919|nr:ATP-binding protein [Sporomusa sp.]HWR41988.1 ATP-binding protein [Sporomusa sp.]
MNAYSNLIRHAGNKQLFHALEMSISAQCNDYPFHIHAEGVRGTGKTTIMRSARKILPSILRIKGCIYNCDPNAPHCPQHRHLTANEVEALESEYIPRPFLEISHSAKIGTVVGSIDIGKLTDKSNSMAALLPGTIPQAHRGIIFIDEINRLADTSPELADVLLDVMGSKPGRVQIEETGLPAVEMPISVSIWAASNPDEEPGSLSLIRKQLADRFDVTVAMERPNDYETVYDILNQPSQTLPCDQSTLALPTGELKLIQVQSSIKRVLAAVYVDFELESLRAVKSLELAASLSTLVMGRRLVTIADVIRVVPLVLAHRTTTATIVNIIKYLETIESDAATCTDAASTAALAMVGAAGNHHKSNMSWWKKLWEDIRKILQAGSFYSSGHQILGANNQSSGSGKMQKPPDAPMIAPAKKALPLSQVPDEQFVTVEAKK